MSPWATRSGVEGDGVEPSVSFDGVPTIASLVACSVTLPGTRSTPSANWSHSRARRRSRSTATTFAPSATSSSTVAEPMPDPAPVTTTTRSLLFMSCWSPVRSRSSGSVLAEQIVVAAVVA